MESPIVQTTKQGIENMLVELRAQRAVHAAALAQIDDTVTKLEGVSATIGVSEVQPKKRAAAKSTAPKKGSKPAQKAVKEPKAVAQAAPKAAAKPVAKKTSVKKAAAKAATKKAAAKPAVKKGSPKSTAARLAAAGSAKLDPTTAVEAAGFSPRIVKFCKAAGITTIADLSKHDIRELASKAERIGEGAIQEMIASVKRAGLKPSESAKPNGAAAHA